MSSGGALERKSDNVLLDSLAERAFTRITGSDLIDGNSVRVLKDATENYPEWMEALAGARSSILFESYIIHDDPVGREFAALMAEKARSGVRVLVMYDWVGALGTSSRRLWRTMRAAGVEVRCFNPPRFDSPIGWIERDHRKMIAVDGRIGFVTGLCVGQRWVGFPDRGIEPWRDTGVVVTGPAVADITRAFAQTWRVMGSELPESEMPARSDIEATGDARLRVVPSMPAMGGLYRLDQVVAASARESLWLTDAYFVGTTSYIQALRSAALDGVDVRLLVPQSSDIALIGALSRTGYRTLLDAGVRVFEWNGPMLHAKTAVSDGSFARVGSTNLNLMSWVGNWELDVVVADEEFAGSMEEMYLDDLENATEIVLSDRHRVRPIRPRKRLRRVRPLGRGSAGRAAAGAIGIGNAVGSAITNHRTLGPAEAKPMLLASGFLAILATVGLLWPRVVTVPIAVMGVWIALSLMVKAIRLWWSGGQSDRRVSIRSVNGDDDDEGA
jgi:cardiolipin synthase